MSAVTPDFLFGLERRMRAIVENDYDRLSKKTWWQAVAKRTDSVSKFERLVWLLSTAKIERPNASHGGGQAIFEDMVSMTTEYEAQNAVAGLRLKKEQLLDVWNGTPGGEALYLAGQWARDVTKYAAYWPQEVVSDAIKANPITYDGKAFFAADHPLNPYAPELGTYANVFAGAASGQYPGALPIDTTVSVEQALNNLAKAIAYVASIKMPNGKSPRNLKLGGIIVPPMLSARAKQLTNAKFIAQAATSGALTGDVEAVVRDFGLGQPIEAPELGAAFGGSDTDYYLVAEDITASELGAFAYVEREPFSIVYHDGVTSAELSRMREFQWTTEGRNTVGAGHPYLLFKCRST